MLLSLITTFAQPTLPAPTPSNVSSSVISLFSNAYTNVGIDTWRTVWSNATLSELQIAGNDTKLYTNLDFVGVEFTGANNINATAMQFYHVDVWTANATTFRIKLVDLGANANFGGGDDVEHEYIVPTLTQNGWNSYDIPLSDFTNLTTRAHLQQMIFSALPTSTANVYIDNVFFYNNPNAPILSNFSIPAQLSTNAPFTITAPTSNSTGAFTYSSSNTNVATVSGNTITFTGIGSSVITATQAAAGGYTSGNITTTLIVTPGAAPTPTVAAADVLSLFSNAYTNVNINTWRTTWSAANLTEIQLGGNDTKLYTNLNFVGVEFTGANIIDATNMQNFHVDVFTPNATTFRIKLVDLGANAAFGGGDDVEHEYVVPTLTLNGWNSYDIPLSSFTSLTSRSHLAQLIFSAVPVGGATAYIDNVYFWRAPNAPTITNFTIPAQVTGAAPFTITAPTSNSSGAFTYTSSNTNVATINGNIITIVGGGTTTITATQAAAGVYGAGTITAPLIVGFAPPMSPAPTPTALSTNVISVFSNTYTNLAGTDFFPNWGQSTIVSEIAIGSDVIKKMDNLNYQGTQFATPLDVSTMQFLHIDIWTPNCTAFELFLINPGPVEQKVTLTPNNTGWNSFNIPLSQYTTINLANIIQFKYVSIPFGGTTVYVDNIYFYRNNAVPVKLINFTAIASKNVTNLSWTTLNEINNKGFTVQKSEDAINFKAIGFVNGKGNATNSNNYSTADKAISVGYNYYRLKQEDLDGIFTYSAIVKVKFENNDLLSFTYFPNPTKNILKVNINAIVSDNATINLVNEMGQVVITQQLKKSSIGAVLDIKINNLTNGNYYLQLYDGNSTTTQKVVIIN